jgi:multicomponent Na+:H+ antiporter subunit C
MAGLVNYLVERGPYLLFVLLSVLGTYLMMSHRNYVKAITGLYLFQSGVILFFISLAFRTGATIPITEAGATLPLHNPLPQALMLTAIVVGVGTLGVAIAIVRRIQAESGSIEEQTAAGPAA